MRKNNADKLIKIGKRRKKLIVIFGLIISLLIVLIALGIKYNEIFKLDDKDIKVLMIAFYFSLLFLGFITIVNLIAFFRTNKTLQGDLKNLYYNKRIKGKIIIPLVEINRITARIKSKKIKGKKIKSHGTLIIRAKKTYKIKNIKDVEFVENEIKHLIEKQQAYLMGLKAGQKMKLEQNNNLNG